MQYASDCREQDGIKTTVLVDDLEGSVHQAYGEMPNMVYIIGKDGRIAYRSMWTDHMDIAAMLASLVEAEELARQGVRPRPTYTERLTFRSGYGNEISQKVLGRAGPKAQSDFRTAIGPG